MMNLYPNAVQMTKIRVSDQLSNPNSVNEWVSSVQFLIKREVQKGNETHGQEKGEREILMMMMKMNLENWEVRTYVVCID